ncbi:hypothetical protein HDA40_004098 [Hamadaea flava]|uniref:Uncharacterized protein n=1 Tax=Hamadaea flava TaxID=1742688 RepID=A0ABV8LHL6_9ACTN|nr:hypothetical protein [Hamadaea flava]MCP2325591.1 hypothetical protein [Hamadaea flava]
MNPLVEEASKKAAIAWVAFGGPAYAVWCLPLEGKLYVISGPGEQDLPGLADALSAESRATVSLRGDHGGRIVSFDAAITEIHSNGTEFETVAPQLAQKRLNASGTTEEVVARWARDCVLISLEAQETVQTPDDSESEAPRPATVLRATRKPFRLHRVKKR